MAGFIHQVDVHVWLIALFSSLCFLSRVHGWGKPKWRFDQHCGEKYHFTEDEPDKIILLKSVSPNMDCQITFTSENPLALVFDFQKINFPNCDSWIEMYWHNINETAIIEDGNHMCERDPDKYQIYSMGSTVLFRFISAATNYKGTFLVLVTAYEYSMYGNCMNPNTKRCSANNRCILPALFCNGNNNCADNEDEAGCPVESMPTLTGSLVPVGFCLIGVGVAIIVWTHCRQRMRARRDGHAAPEEDNMEPQEMTSLTGI